MDPNEVPELSGVQRFNGPSSARKLHEIAERALATGNALEVYAASLQTIDRTRPEGRVYLADLAEILALAPALVRQMHERNNEPPPAQAPLPASGRVSSYAVG